MQCGPRILAVIVYLYMGQYLSKNRTATAMAELFNTPVSEGTVGSATARAATDLDAFGIAVADRIAAADVAYFDETGFRAAGKLHWLHSASTAMFSAITCHKVGDKHRALARRLIARIEDYLRFATDPAVPWDNNAAEREIRMPKLRQKVSGGMRTLTGAQHFAALRSYVGDHRQTRYRHPRRTHPTHHRNPLDSRNNLTSLDISRT